MSNATIDPESIINDLSLADLSRRFNGSTAGLVGISAELDRIRRRRGPFPYVWVRERGQRGRVHGHLLGPTSMGDDLEESWSHGRVDRRPVQSVEERRQVANYLGKSFDEPMLPCRYYRARGFSPEVEVVIASSKVEFRAIAAARFGGVPPARTSGTGHGGTSAGMAALWVPNPENGFGP